jgi:adenylate cyclase
MESAERVRDRASREISERVATFLGGAPAAVAQFQQEVDHGLVDARAPLAVEPALFVLLLSAADISEITFTYGNQIGFGEDGALRLAPTPRGQVSVVRESEGDRFLSRHIRQENDGFVADRRELTPGASFSELPMSREAGADLSDPTLHPTFVTPAREDFSGQLLWSDLHWSQLDAALPESRRRVEVSVAM